jgi:heme/copper-type cytochrome/quinol oxidase subunit 2
MGLSVDGCRIESYLNIIFSFSFKSVANTLIIIIIIIIIVIFVFFLFEWVELYLHSPNTPSWHDNQSTGTTLPFFRI